MNEELSKTVKFDRNMANAYAVQAMMSCNAYLGTNERIYFPLEDLGWRKVNINGDSVSKDKNSYTPKSTFGDLFSNLQFDIWEQENTTDTIIAFKGTDGIIDWIVANLSVFSIAYRSAKKQVDVYHANYPNRHISLTGHSLGGGLALSVSVKSGFAAVVFNTSPRIFDGIHNMNKPAVRKVIFQHNDILQCIRRMYVKFIQKIPEKDIIQTNFVYQKASEKPTGLIGEIKKSFEAHRIDLLAVGILNFADDEQLVKLAHKININTYNVI